MPHTQRYNAQNSPIPLRELPAAALRAVLREGYNAQAFRKDILAGLVVGVVALPLSMALAIGVGAPPQHGLYTAIVGGFFTALFGGSRYQVTGPTAAFIVILAPICAKYGLGGLLLAGLMGGVILLAMGLLRMGRLIQFVPHPVTTGFTAGIAVVIATLQIKDVLGLQFPGNPEHFTDRLAMMWQARGTASLAEFAVGIGTLALLVFLPKLTSKVPAPLVALPFVGIAAFLLERFVPGFAVQTISERFAEGIPRAPPMPLLPWNIPAADGSTLPLSLDVIRALLPGAFAIAMLGAIESLLSAVVADGMGQTKHDPDSELIGQGIGNVITPFFGGIPATGAIARTATNIRSGGRSPIAAMVHAVVVLLAVLVLAPLIGYLPMSALAGLLLKVAWNMSDRKHFAHILRVAPRSDVTVLLTCFGLTVFFDMVIAVGVGVTLAALLFMRRMAEVTQAQLSEGTHHALPRALPPGVLVYDVNGPLFFGAAQRAVNALGSISSKTRTVILRMDNVPAMDATGLVALESSLQQLGKVHTQVIISGVQKQPRSVLEKAQLQQHYRFVSYAPDIASALAAAEREPTGPRSHPPGKPHPVR